jgi:hypothetical protein
MSNKTNKGNEYAFDKYGCSPLNINVVKIKISKISMPIPKDASNDLVTPISEITLNEGIHILMALLSLWI